MNSQALYIGLMSGTSADSVDAAVVDFGGEAAQLIATYNHPLDNSLQRRIHDLAIPGDNEIDRLGSLDRELGLVFADAAKTLLNQAHISPGLIRAIGSHGQTVRHRPDNKDALLPFTLQIGDPNTIALVTGITTVADFRRKDMAAGGQGAPLAPTFHREIFHSEDCERMVVNIGGMSNITHLPRDGKVRGFDTGPGNVLMDAWIFQQRGERYDNNGDWAASGQIDAPLLQRLLLHPFFQQTGPKSTGREAFNSQWLETVLAQCAQPPAAVRVQASLLELTAQTIAEGVGSLKQDPSQKIFICGGGANNRHLVRRLGQLLAPSVVTTTDTLGLPADWVEAAAFAWLAKRSLSRQIGNIATVTGAEQDVVLGGIYFV